MNTLDLCRLVSHRHHINVVFLIMYIVNTTSDRDVVDLKVHIA